MAYTAFVTRITNVRTHPDAHSLLLGECFGNQVVVGLDTKENDIGIYLPTDGRLSTEYLKINNLIRNVVDGKNIGGLFDPNGKVRTQKLRGEKSDGYFCSLSSVSYTGVDPSLLIVGLAFTELNGFKICEKYVNIKTQGARDKKPREKTKFPTFYEMPDTMQLAYRLDELKDGMFLVMTEKLHGTSQRSSNSIEVRQSWYGRIINYILKRTAIEPHKEYKYVCGTRHVVIKDFATYRGFYGDNEKYREHAHNLFVDKLRKGETVYYEIVGYVAEGSPIMATADNTKTKDKEFIQKYGKTTHFTYGCAQGVHRVFVYRVTTTNEDGDEVDYSWEMVKQRCAQMDVDHVPELERVIFRDSKMDGTTQTSFLKHLDYDLVTGESTICPKHLREGVVVRADGSKWTVWKHKSFHFKVLEDIIKLDEDTVDIEEAQGE